MKKVICYTSISAINYWYENQFKIDSVEFENIGSRAFTSASTDDIIAVSKTLDIYDPTHSAKGLITVLSSANNYHDNKHPVERLTVSAKIPKKCFYHVTNIAQDDIDIYVACPELAILQYVSKMPFYEALVFVYFFVASFMLIDQQEIDFYDTNPDQKIDITPLTTSQKLQQFCKRCKNVSGIKQLTSISKLVRNNAKSPMEIIICALLTCPHIKGGYNVGEGLELNSVMELTEQDGIGYAGYSRYPDLWWKKQKAIIEYNGRRSHYTAEQQHSDSEKLLIYEHRGILAITVVYEDILNRYDFEKKVIKPLVKQFSKRLHLPENFEQKNSELKEWLLGKSYLRPWDIFRHRSY